MGQSIWSHLRLLIMAVTLMLVSVSLAPAPVEAEAPCRDELLFTCSYVEIYYSDAQRTNEVGRYFWLCDGPNRLVGETTNFTTFFVIGSCTEVD